MALTESRMFSPEGGYSSEQHSDAKSSTIADVIPLPKAEGFLFGADTSGEPKLEVIEETSREVGPLIIVKGYARIADAVTHYTITEPHPDDVEDPIGILIVNGFGGIKEAYTDLDTTFALNGRRSISFKPIRKQGFRGRLDIRHRVNPLKLHSQGAYAVMRAVQEEHGIEQFDVAGHSLGGVAGTDVARHHPNLVRSLILMGSAGLEDHNLAVMASRVPAFLRDELVPALPILRERYGSSTIVKEFEYLLESPSRTLTEMVAVSRADITNRVRLVGQLGVMTAALQFNEDRLFFTENVRAKSAWAFDEFRVYSDMLAGHIAPQIDPEGVALETLDIIQVLKKQAVKS